MEQRGNKIYALSQQDSTLSVKQRDSLYHLGTNLATKGYEISSYYRFFIPKEHTLSRLDSALNESSTKLNLAVKTLINIASDRDVYPSDREEAIKKLAISKHPLALDYLVANITTVFSRTSDPGMYGRMSFYAYEPDYPHFKALWEHVRDAQLLFYLKKYWKKYLMAEYEANLYAYLLSSCMEPCGDKCAQAFLITLRDQYCYDDDDKRLRENAIRILAYYANPNRY